MLANKGPIEESRNNLPGKHRFVKYYFVDKKLVVISNINN